MVVHTSQVIFYTAFSVKHEGLDGLTTGVAAPLPRCSQSTHVQNQRGGCGAVLTGRDVKLSDGALNSAGSWDIWMGWVATLCHTSKPISLGAQLKLRQHDTKMNPPSLFGGCRYSMACASGVDRQGRGTVG